MISEIDAMLSIKFMNLHWQMTTCERFSLQHILNYVKPSRAIEIGTYKGGSLQVISAFSKKVDSIDIDPSVKVNLHNNFENVDFHIGNSSSLVRELLIRHNNANEPVEFILIDGDHTKEGVKRDIESIISVTPQKNLIILIHDSFNPECRDGIIDSDWSLSSFVHYVEIDFVPGIYHETAYDTGLSRSMWGGFACIVMLPVKRDFQLIVSQKQKGLFDAVKAKSRYNAHSTSIFEMPKKIIKKYIKKIGIFNTLN